MLGEVWAAQTLPGMVPEEGNVAHLGVKFRNLNAPLRFWFQYLSSPESHHLIPELIRFICCVIHPTNEVLASDIIPRWALIGWLISLCQV